MDKKRLAKLSQIGEEIAPSSALPHIEIEGNTQAVVEGCRGIIEYDCNIVRINCGAHIVKFTGCEMKINALSCQRISVNGTIATIEFC